MDTLGIKRLSRRELQIFKFILHGFTDPQMASYLNISVTSIRSIIKSLKIKLQCRSKLDIICSSIKNGWTYFLTEAPLPEKK
ncbi:response regulator transcription factor [Rickettsiella massiliensis]|uniref:response regulator transcription factor n=1 Tax=Rickettsiella massiliensis TaxID=676517 RepID=UPI00029AD20F|nr:helix-turn-helix transcriptional regulator [Rickettsiella massiliensis]